MSQSFVFKRFTRFCQRLELRFRYFGKLEIEITQGRGDNVGNQGARRPLVVGGNDVPGRPFGAGGVNRVFIRLPCSHPNARVQQDRRPKISSSSQGAPAAP